MKGAAVLAGSAALLAGCMPPDIAPSRTEATKPIRIARPCERRHLEPRLYLQPATQKLVGQITFRVTGNRRCSIFPFPPRVWLSGASRQVKVYEIASTVPRGLRNAPRPQSLRAGDKVAIDLEWSNWCAPSPNGLMIEIRFSGAYRLRPRDTPKCLSEDLPSQIGVGPVLPAR